MAQALKSVQTGAACLFWIQWVLAGLAVLVSGFGVAVILLGALCRVAARDGGWLRMARSAALIRRQRSRRPVGSGRGPGAVAEPAAPLRLRNHCVACRQHADGVGRTLTTLDEPGLPDQRFQRGERFLIIQPRHEIQAFRFEV